MEGYSQQLKQEMSERGKKMEADVQERDYCSLMEKAGVIKEKGLIYFCRN